jgi:hypothetical protein
VQILLRQKGAELDLEYQKLDQQIQAIEAQRASVLRRARDEIVDVLVVVLAAGAEPAELAQAMKPYKPLLSRLGASDVDLVREARER